MNIQLQIGGTEFRFESDMALTVEDSLAPFFCTFKKVNAVNVCVTAGDPEQWRPKTPPAGEDLLLEYFYSEGALVCMAKGGVGGYLSAAVCDEGLENIRCVIRPDTLGSLGSVGSVLRLIPVRTILQRRDVMFFHASQIAVRGKGILFTAPSGTGKTTQAKLWREYRGARIICNDRTLIHQGTTFGYPIDGSEPVISGERYPLGAVVYLRQSSENRIRRMKPREVMTNLMQQLVFDSWDQEARTLALNQLIRLMECYPVYELGCMPDEAAVACLERQLIMDGVISNDGN